jgi:hypothetical protein
LIHVELNMPYRRRGRRENVGFACGD